MTLHEPIQHFIFLPCLQTISFPSYITASTQNWYIILNFAIQTTLSIANAQRACAWGVIWQ